MEKFLIGTKYFRFANSSVPEIYRLKKQQGNILYLKVGDPVVYLTKDEYKDMVYSKDLIQDEDTFKRIIDFFGNTVEQIWTLKSEDIDDEILCFEVEDLGVSVTVTELKQNFTRLIPNGIIAVSNIDYHTKEEDKVTDVLVTFNKTNKEVPDIICRQSLVNIFRYSQSMYMPIGLSITQSACPKSINYLDFLNADEVKDFKCTAFYIGDSIQTTLKFIGAPNKYNRVLRELKKKYDGTQMIGCTESLKELLTTTGFFDDIRESLGIFTYPFALNMSKSEFSKIELRLLNSVLNSEIPITEAYYCPYDGSIDLNKLSDKHMLIEANSGAFIVLYRDSEIE